MRDPARMISLPGAVARQSEELSNESEQGDNEGCLTGGDTKEPFQKIGFQFRQTHVKVLLRNQLVGCQETGEGLRLNFGLFFRHTNGLELLDIIEGVKGKSCHGLPFQKKDSHISTSSQSRISRLSSPARPPR
jgi:hypothetical protein